MSKTFFFILKTEGMSKGTILDKTEASGILLGQSFYVLMVN